MHSAISPFSFLPLAIWSDWWLNPNYAEHGKPMDEIFYFVFWLTGFIFVATQGALIWFLIKYRFRPDRKKGIYSHGNTRIEMVWTIIPALILIVLAVWTRRVWDNYRYSPTSNDPSIPKILVIGEQFKWNVLYGGPRNKIGRYLLYPKATDLKWPTVPEGQTFNFPDVPGPAYLPEQQAQAILDNYVGTINPLGRDYGDTDTNPDPNGEDKELRELNDRQNALSRVIVLPKGRAVEIQLGSRDVIHDFFLPNFRTKLDVVPGMRGRLYIKADSDCPGPLLYTLAELQSLIDRKQEVMAIVNKNTPDAVLFNPGRRHPKYLRLATLKNGDLITSEAIKAARDAGISKIMATITYDVVCEELCGQGHADMKGKVIVLDEATLKESPYNNYFPAVVSSAAESKAAPVVLGAAKN